MRSTTRNALALIFTGALTLAACGGDPGATGSPDPETSAGASEPAATGGPPGDVASTLRIQLDAQVGNLSNAAEDIPTSRLADLVYDSLYTIDASLQPVPQLAEDLCDVSEDEVTWTCSLIDTAVFHNGDPITADDVVYSFRLAASPNCTYAASACLTDFVASVEALDDQTVEFTLHEPFAPFATVFLPGIGIESQAVIESAYQEFSGQAGDVDLEEAGSAISAIEEATGADAPESTACEEAAALGTGILDTAAIEYGAPEDFAVEDDPETDEDEASDGQCDFAASLLPVLNGLLGSLESQGVDAVAAAYNLLSFNREPVGSGPYRVESIGLEGVVLKAFEDYWQGSPPTETIELPIFTDVATAAQALAAGELDIVRDLTPDARAAIEGAVADGSIKLAEYNELGHYDLQYNMHEELPLADGTSWQGWFYDVNLRQAVQYCIDKAQLVEIATDGNGVPIEADIPPASWAFNPDITSVERDVAAATELIESASVHTWTLGDDGIYVNEDGDRLSALILVRAGQQDRVDFMNLLAEQVLECGIELKVEAVDFQTVLIPALDFPHVPAGQSEPWHAYFGGWGVGVDPDPYSLFHSSQCTTEARPELFNYVCLQDEEIDRLIEEGLAVSDQDARSEIYFEYQARMQELQPYLFAWSNVNADAFAAGVGYSQSELPLDSPAWDWLRHDLVKVTGE
jgi:ABC-type transport system substrate-binding protein